MTDSVSFIHAQFVEGHAEDRLREVPLHCAAYRHVLQIRQGAHPLHVGKKEPLVPDLAEPFVVSVIQDSVAFSNGIAEKEVEFFKCDTVFPRKKLNGVVNSLFDCKENYNESII